MGEEDINKERLELALEAAGLDLWENDLLTGNVTCKAMKTFAELGYSEKEAFVYIDDMFSIVHPDDVPVIKASINERMTGAKPQYRSEFRLLSKGGKWIWYANYGKIINGRGVKYGKRFIGATFNINDRKCQEDELRAANRKLAEQNALLEKMNLTLQSLSTTDPLTHLPNRRLLLERLNQALAARMRNGQTGALLFVDIDNFKTLNDTLGHDMGDLMLQQVAKRLEYCVREGDTIARIGGDEFVVMLEDLSRVPLEAAAQTEAVGEKIRETLASHTSWVPTNTSARPASVPRCSMTTRRRSEADRHRHVSGEEGRSQYLAFFRSANAGCHRRAFSPRSGTAQGHR